MAFTGRTPESLIPRSDSRNPATTCKGMTKSGRPCRRPIDAKQREGVLAVVSVADDSEDEGVGAAAYFCWQHKDQAERLAAEPAVGPHQHDTQLYPLQERNSIDTLVARLGVLEVQEQTPQDEQRKRRRQSRQDRRGASGNRPSGKAHRPPAWDNVDGPLMSVPSDLMAEKQRLDQRRESRLQERKKSSLWQFLCCGSADDDYVEVVRHKKRASQGPVTAQYVSEASMPQVPQRAHQPARPVNVNVSNPNTSSGPSNSVPGRRPLSDSNATASRLSNNVPTRKPLGEKPAKPLNKTAVQPQTSTETSKLLANIPKSLNPQTTSLLLSELSKPISPHDEEGYIYIFWLTPESLGPAPSSTASTLLAPPSRPDQTRRTSDVLRQYSVRRPQQQRSRPDPPPSSRNRSSGNITNPEQDTTTSLSSSKNTILLKIGRANNVHRRMNEWSRQCGYSLSLVRWYPYVPSTPTPTPSPTPSPHTSPAHSRQHSYQNTSASASARPTDHLRRVSEGGGGPSTVRKVPHAHRVERLIHIELAAQRVAKKCDACAKEHREWFEVEASREGVRAVDAVVRRWVGWGEGANQL